MTNWALEQKKNLLSSLLTEAAIQNFKEFGHSSSFSEEAPRTTSEENLSGADEAAGAQKTAEDQRVGSSTGSEALSNKSEELDSVMRDRNRGADRDDRRSGGRDGRRRSALDDNGGTIEKLVHINRVSKTVKGGKRFGFGALVVVGDGQGRVGFGHGKAREVPEAINKATAAAKKSMIRVPLKDGRTLHHDGRGHFGAGNVTVRSAPAGTGIIAGGAMRAVFESLGVADVVTKSHGTTNPYNMIRATFEALSNQATPRQVAARRGKKIRKIINRSTTYVEQDV